MVQILIAKALFLSLPLGPPEPSVPTPMDWSESWEWTKRELNAALDGFKEPWEKWGEAQAKADYERERQKPQQEHEAAQTEYWKRYYGYYQFGYED